MNHTETNEDWKELIREKAKKISCDEEEAELYVQDIIYIVSAKIRSLRQSDKELILGKMVKKGYTQEQIEEYDETNSRDDAMEKGRMIGINQTLDTCKSIVEETLK